jgi:hypothetical protein
VDNRFFWNQFPLGRPKALDIGHSFQAHQATLVFQQQPLPKPAR